MPQLIALKKWSGIATAQNDNPRTLRHGGSQIEREGWSDSVDSRAPETRRPDVETR